MSVNSVCNRQWDPEAVAMAVVASFRCAASAFASVDYPRASLRLTFVTEKVPMVL